MSSEQRIVVVGAGFMGAGIAQVCAQSGHRVHLVDIDPSVLDKALSGARSSVEKLYLKGLISESADTIMGRITSELDMSCAAKADWIIEAATEIEDLKKEMFQELDRLAPAHAILATNTSTIPVSRLAEVTTRPDRVLGLHFFGPVPLMGLVEVVKGKRTSDEVFERGVAFIKALGKTPVRVNHDIPGFVMNRIFLAAFSQALDLVTDGVVSPEDADIGMKLGYGWNSGPFEIADNAGIDTFSLVIQSFQSFGEEAMCPRSNMLEKMIAQGRVGRKCGKGFYDYSADGKKITGSKK